MSTVVILHTNLWSFLTPIEAQVRDSGTQNPTKTTAENPRNVWEMLTNRPTDLSRIIDFSHKRSENGHKTVVKVVIKRW